MIQNEKSLSCCPAGKIPMNGCWSRMNNFQTRRVKRQKMPL